MKKILSFSLALLMAAGSSGAFAEAPAEDGHVSLITDPAITASLEQGRELIKVTDARVKPVPLYFFMADSIEEMDLTFFNGNEYVAYMDMENSLDMLNGLIESIYPGASYTMAYGEYGEKTCVIRHPQGAEALVDFVDGVVYFSDLDQFRHVPDAVSGGDSVSFPTYQVDAQGNILKDSEGTPLVYLIRRAADNPGSFTKSGYPILVPLAPANRIPIYWYEGKGYLPVTTFCDLFWLPFGSTMVYLDGKLFLSSREGVGPRIDGEQTIHDAFYSIAAGDRPQELVEYTYNELVMMLDLHYGLKEEHGITGGFDTFFIQTGLAEGLLSNDGKVFSDALNELLAGYFGDLHSSFLAPGPYAGETYSFDASRGNLVSSSAHSDMNMERFEAARADSKCVDENGNFIPYMEVGDTAYITFDLFRTADLNYYDPEVQKTFPDYLREDLVALVHYAHIRINRQGSPIKNVVIDLSNNSGGEANVAAYIGAWVLGQFEFNTVNATSEAQYTVTYTADVDLDGYITEEDRLDLSRLNVYCLICENSFSCGNLVPCAFKQSGLVTLLGQTSGGGACVVLPMLTADGTAIRISSMNKICMVKNGIFYSVDRGVDPDVPIRQLSHFYDREWLTDFINQLP